MIYEKGDKRIFKAWLYYFLISTVAGMIVGTVVGFLIAAFIDIALQSDFRLGPEGGQVVGYIVGIPVSYLAFRWSVREYFLTEPGEYENQELDSSQGQPVGGTRDSALD